RGPACSPCRSRPSRSCRAAGCGSRRCGSAGECRRGAWPAPSSAASNQGLRGGARSPRSRCSHVDFITPARSPPPCRIRSRAVKFALAQINPTIGAFEGNRRLVLDAVAAAEARGAELAVFPELALCGYPPKDLLERPAFIEAARASLDALAAALA